MYAASFFVIPALRWLLNQQRNLSLQTANRIRLDRLRELREPDPALQRKLVSAEKQAQRTVIRCRTRPFGSETPPLRLPVYQTTSTSIPDLSLVFPAVCCAVGQSADTACIRDCTSKRELMAPSGVPCRDQDIIYRSDRNVSDQKDPDEADFDRRLAELEGNGDRRFNDWIPQPQEVDPDWQQRRR